MTSSKIEQGAGFRTEFAEAFEKARLGQIEARVGRNRLDNDRQRCWPYLP
jgi:hypothetical protein